MQHHIEAIVSKDGPPARLQTLFAAIDSVVANSLHSVRVAPPVPAHAAVKQPRRGNLEKLRNKCHIFLFFLKKN